MLGLALGVARLTLMFLYQGEDNCGWEPRAVPSVLNIHYMYFATFTTLLTTLVALFISYLSAPPDPKLVSTTRPRGKVSAR